MMSLGIVVMAAGIVLAMVNAAWCVTMVVKRHYTAVAISAVSCGLSAVIYLIGYMILAQGTPQ